MLSPRFMKILSDKRAATAVALAILFVPLVIAASAVVDFSRVSSARALLQASVDSAAQAGGGAYQTSQSHTSAQNVAQTTFSGTGVQLPKFVTAGAPTIGVYCSSQGTSTQCGTGSSSTGTLSGLCPSGWDANKEYCVVVTATATLHNSLFAWLVPSEALSATAVATTSFPPLVINQGSFSNTNIGYGSSLSGAYVYVVPKDSGNNPLYSTLPTPNTNCENSNNGPISNEQSYINFATPATGVTTCNYLLIAENATGAVSGSLAILNTDLIAFSFVNDLNERNASGGSSNLDDTTYTSGVVTRGGTSPQPNSGQTATSYTNEIYVAPGSGTPSPTGCTTTSKDGIYCAAGYTVPASANYQTVTTTTTCKTWNTNTNACTTTNTPTSATTYSSTSTSNTTGCTLNKNTCTSSVSTSVSTYGTPNTATALGGNCPAHGLYGAIEDYYVSGSDIVPEQDSINTYTSAYEALGYPPTYATNSVLTPFLGPVTSVSATVATTTPGSTTAKTSTYTYNVQAVCPQWPTTGTNISATGTGSFTPSGYSSTAIDQETVSTFGTYFPGATATDGVSGHVFAPPIAGCSPITSATSALPNASSSSPWWGWAPSNSITTDPNNTIVNSSGTKVNSTDCTTAVLNSGHTGIAVTTGTGAQQSALYNNCGLIIQPLGNGVPTNSSGSSRLPDYYGYVVDPSGFSSGKTGNPSGIIAMFPVFDEVTSGTKLSYPIPTPAALPSIADITGTGISAAAGSAGYTQITVSNAPGYVPTGATTVHANTDGTYTVIEPPVNGTDGNLPQDTSYQCYNSQANGFVSGTYAGDNNNKTAIDPVANPQLGGSIQCGTSPPPSYGIYWNNLGTDVPMVNDDLGYGNAVTVFTCPTPSSTTGGGPSTLSG